MDRYQIDSRGYRYEVGRYVKEAFGECTPARGKARTQTFDFTCPDTGEYKDLGEFADEPGIFVDELKMPISWFDRMGDDYKHYRLFMVEADVSFRTYVVTQCINFATDCRGETSCRNWYQRLMVPWRLSIDAIISSMTDVTASSCSAAIRWDLPRLQNIVDVERTVGRVEEFNQVDCQPLAENMDACLDVAQWCTPFFRRVGPQVTDTTWRRVQT